MRIKYAPLLYARTYRVEFGSQFLSQPDFFTGEDAAYAFSIVESSMDRFRFLDGNGRRVVFGNGNYVVTGYVVRFEDLFEKCGQVPKYHILDHPNGRPAYGFIGAALPVDMRAQGVPDIPLEVFLQSYCEQMALPVGMRASGAPDILAEGKTPTRWEEKHRSSVRKAPLADLEVRALGKEELLDDKTVSYILGKCRQPKAAFYDSGAGQYRQAGIAVLKSGHKQREAIAASVYALAMRGAHVAFCSDVDDIRLEYRQNFNIVTCQDPQALQRSHAKDKEADAALAPANAPVGYDAELAGKNVPVGKPRRGKQAVAGVPKGRAGQGYGPSGGGVGTGRPRALSFDEQLASIGGGFGRQEGPEAVKKFDGVQERAGKLFRRRTEAFQQKKR